MSREIKIKHEGTAANARAAGGCASYVFCRPSQGLDQLVQTSDGKGELGGKSWGQSQGLCLTWWSDSC